MAIPERQQPTDLNAVLADIDRRLELAAANENTIERYFKRDELLELRDVVQDEIAETPQDKRG